MHVIVVRGAGDQAFVSGADISEFDDKRTTVAAREEYDDALAASWRSWREVDKPIIAMIRGYCIGGGLLTAMKADIRIAADDSQFGVPAAQARPRVRATAACEELMTLVGPRGRRRSSSPRGGSTADEALRIGLVNRVVPVDELEAQVRELAAPSPRTRRSR